MDSTDEEFYGSTSFTIKGRRTKRKRTTTTTSSHGGCVDTSYGSTASATPSITNDHDAMSEVTTEEQDLANCLILLAQGRVKKRRSSTNDNKISTSTTIHNNKVYECKTCNRTFPSFQALGGHRTSHKKVVKPPAPNNHQRHLMVVGDFNLSSQSSNNYYSDNNNNNNNNNNKARLHECLICGNEFSSGQALGGHMRRHRPATVPPLLRHGDHPIAAVLSTAVIDSGGPRNALSLDLNLPAPHDDDDDDDHMVENKFHVIPTPALVDCHY